MTEKNTKTIGEQLEQKREPYWDYMAHRLRETRGAFIATNEDMWKQEVAQMQKSIHDLQMRVIKHNERIHELEHKIKILGGDPKQLEMRF